MGFLTATSNKLEETVAFLKQQLILERHRRNFLAAEIKRLKEDYTQLQTDLFSILNVAPVSTHYPEPGKNIPLQSNTLNSLKKNAQIYAEKFVAFLAHKPFLKLFFVQDRHTNIALVFPVTKSSDSASRSAI